MKLSPIVDHGYLLGLGDDDHPQYLHLNKAAQTLRQNLAVTGGVTIDGVDISAHAANVSAHHARYTNAEAVAAVSAGNLTKLVVETNTLVADGGKVGIGRADPGGKLEVRGAGSGGTVPDIVISGGVSGADINDIYVLDSKNLAGGLGYGARAIGVNIQNQVNAANAVLQRTEWGGATGAAAIHLGTYTDGHFGVLTSPSGSSAGTVLTEKFRVHGNGDVSIPSGTITHQGAILKSGTQAEGRCHAGLSPFEALAGNQVTVCFRERMTNTPSSVTLSNVATTDENNIEAGYPQALRVSIWSFGFFIRAAALGDANSCDKKYLTVGN